MVPPVWGQKPRLRLSSEHQPRWSWDLHSTSESRSFLRINSWILTVTLRQILLSSLYRGKLRLRVELGFEHRTLSEVGPHSSPCCCLSSGSRLGGHAEERSPASQASAHQVATRCSKGLLKPVIANLSDLMDHPLVTSDPKHAAFS